MIADDDAMEELWMLFSAEYEEYLSVAETILATPGEAVGRIDELFRAFHSIKGGAAALSLRSIEKVSHAAEDILHKVRNGEMSMERPVEDVMLAAIDELRKLESSALGARVDQPVNTALVDRLKAFLANDTPSGPTSSQQRTAAAKDATARNAAPASTDITLVAHDAEEVDLTILQDPVLSLAGALDDEPGPAAEYLAMMASILGQEGIAAAARRLAAGTGLTENADRWRLLDLIERLYALENGFDVAVGAMALLGTAEAQMAELLQETAADLKSNMDDAGLWRRASRLLCVLDIHDLAELADLAASRVMAGIVDVQFAEIADMMALTGIFMETGGGAPIDEIDTLRMGEFRRCGIVIDSAAVDSGNALILPKQAGDGMSPEAREALALAAKEGLPLVLVHADLEADPLAAEAVMEHLRRQLIIISRWRLADGPGHFGISLAAREPLESLISKLLQADPDRVVLLTMHRSDGHVPQGADLLPARPKTTIASTSPPTPAEATAAAPAEKRDAAPTTPRAGAAAKANDSIVRVPSSSIDGLMDRIGDLRLGATGVALAVDRFTSSRARQRLETLIARASGRDRDELMDIVAAITGLQQGLQDGWSQVDGGIRRLYQTTTSLRVVPIGTLFNRLLRPVRETAVAVGKDVTLSTFGDDVQVDKSTLEMLVDPLTHVVRNSIDHGIESPERRLAAGKAATGTIIVRARQGTHTATIEVEDDGAGIDVERVREKAVAKGLVTAQAAALMPDVDVVEMIFSPGFSTREQVTETSGRGVGMDIVATTVRKKLGGTLKVDSRLGIGTTLVIEFPISAAIQRVLSVMAGGQMIAILERAVAEIVDVSTSRIQTMGGRRGTFLRDRFLPIVSLAAAVGWHDRRAPVERDDFGPVIVVDDGHRRIGLAVDAMVGRQEVFFKRLHPLLERNRLLNGIAVIGAGTLLFALDAEALIEAAQHAERSG